MPRRRSEEAELSRYVKKIKEFISFEDEAIEGFELLCSLRDIPIPALIASFISFFKSRIYLNHPDCLVYLHRAHDVIFDSYPARDAANIFEFTASRFRLYFLTLEKLGVLGGRV